MSTPGRPSQPEREAAEAELSFEQALEQLEAIVHALEEGRLGLGESLERYENGVKLLKRCHGLLERAERRIELLSGVDPQGRTVTETLDDRALSLDEKAQTRGRRRSKAPRPAADESESGRDATGGMDDSGTLF